MMTNFFSTVINDWVRVRFARFLSLPGFEKTGQSPYRGFAQFLPSFKTGQTAFKGFAQFFGFKKLGKGVFLRFAQFWDCEKPGKVDF